MGLPDQCLYTDYWYIWTIGQLADWYITPHVAESRGADRIEYSYQSQAMDLSGPAQDLSYLKLC